MFEAPSEDFPYTDAEFAGILPEVPSPALCVLKRESSVAAAELLARSLLAWAPFADHCEVRPEFAVLLASVAFDVADDCIEGAELLVPANWLLDPVVEDVWSDELVAEFGDAVTVIGAFAAI